MGGRNECTRSRSTDGRYFDNFVRFDPDSAPGRAVDKITIAGTGTIQFSKFFCIKNGLESKTHAELFFNKEDRETAVLFLDYRRPISYKLCGREPYRKYISPKSFLKANGIQVTNTTRYTYEKRVREGGTCDVIRLDVPQK